MTFVCSGLAVTECDEWCATETFPLVTIRRYGRSLRETLGKFPPLRQRTAKRQRPAEETASLPTLPTTQARQTAFARPVHGPTTTDNARLPKRNLLPRRPFARRLVVLVVFSLVATACRGDHKTVRLTATTDPETGATVTPSGPTAPTTGPVGAASSDAKVAVIVMENKESGAVAGNPQAPYFNKLAAEYAVAPNWYGIAHPSLPNYLALISGSTFGVRSDCTTCIQNGASLPDQLDRRGITWKGYFEGMPSRCYTLASAGRYAKKHNPFAYFSSIVNNPARCARMVPFTELADDEARGELPRFSFISPDLCNDTHDCGVNIGDAFLSQHVPGLLDALGPHGLLVITYDEGSSNAGCCRLAAGGRIVTVFAGGLAKRGARVEQKLNHYSLLRTIEDLFGLDHLGDAGCACTPDASALLR